MRMGLVLSQLAVLGALTLAGAAAGAQTPDSEKFSQLLQDARQHAYNAEHDAETLYGYTQSRVNWQAHSHQLNRIRDHVNALGKVARDLSDARAEASPWQQDAIDNINPALRELADHLTATITHLNDNPERVHLAAFKDYAQGNYELAQKLRTLINDYADYAKAKGRADALEQKLRVTESGSAGEM